MRSIGKSTSHLIILAKSFDCDNQLGIYGHFRRSIGNAVVQIITSRFIGTEKQKKMVSGRQMWHNF